jgi:hypothetical protein
MSATRARMCFMLADHESRHVTLIGGVAMALAHGSRRTTKDTDVFMQPDIAPEVADALTATVEVA